MKKYYFQCPKCGQDEIFYKVDDSSGDGKGCLMFLVGGPLLFLLTSDSHLVRVKCGGCGYIFRQPAKPTSGLGKVSGWVFSLLLLAGFGYALYSMAPYLEKAENYPHWVQKIADYVQSHKYFITVVVLPAFVITLGLIFIAGIVSNYVFRRNLRNARKTEAVDVQDSDTQQ